MKISNTFNFNKIQFDKNNEVILMTSLKAPKVVSEKERAPLYLSLVLDASTSMGGEKIDKLRKSVVKLIEQLSDKDTVAITMYDSNVEEVLKPTLMTAKNKAEATAKVKSITTGGCTNMSGGMCKGFEQLKSCKLVEGSLYRMLLFTDGQANVGLRDKSEFVDLVRNQINDSSITVSCFGYGRDHDEEILQHIVEVGKGNFYFIDNVDDMAKSFARELGGLLSCHSQNITVYLDMKKESGEFVEVLNDLTSESDTDQRVKVTFDDMYTEEEKHLLVNVKLNKVTKSVTQRGSNIIDVLVTYNDLTDKGKFVEKRSKAKIFFVKKEDVQKESTLEVEEQKVIIDLANALEKAREYADSGNYILAAQGVQGVQGQLGDLGMRGSTIADTLSVDVTATCSTLTSGKYTKAGGMAMSNSARSFKRAKAMDATSQKLYGNKAQDDMLEKFKTTTDTLEIKNGSTSSATVEIKDKKDVTTVKMENLHKPVRKKSNLNKKRTR